MGSEGSAGVPIDKKGWGLVGGRKGWMVVWAGSLRSLTSRKFSKGKLEL